MGYHKIIKHLLTVLIGAYCMVGAYAQSIQVKSATSQHWAGGICCRHGVNYTINLKVIRNKTAILLDTLWLEGYGKSLADYNIKKANKSDTLSIEILDGISFDDGMIDFEVNPKHVYDGTKMGILLEYRIGKKKISLNLSRLIIDLEFLAYP